MCEVKHDLYSIAFTVYARGGAELRAFNHQHIGERVSVRVGRYDLATYTITDRLLKMIENNPSAYRVLVYPAPSFKKGQEWIARLQKN